MTHRFLTSSKQGHPVTSRMATHRLGRWAATGVAALVLCATAHAADAADRMSNKASQAATEASAAISRIGQTSYAGMSDGRQWERTHRASKIIGTDVRNRTGEKVGDVKDVVLDKNGSIAYAVVSTGGFLGIGDRLHAVPWSALDTTSNGKNFVLDIDKNRLKNAPGFDSRHWPNFSDETWASDNRRYYPAAGEGSTSSTSGNR